MPNTSPTDLCTNTPSITIHDNRGGAIIALAYNRTDTHQTPEQLINCNRYNASGQLIASRDPRLEVDNFRYQYSLSGVPLRTDSVDSGSTLQLADSAGRTVLTRDAHHTRRWVEYETGEHSLGRPLSYREQAKGGLKTVTDRFFYGENSEQDKGCNLNGQCVRHYDSAGLQALISQSIIDVPLQQQRRLLTETKGPVDWFGEKENWGARLSESPFVSHCTTNALGQLITQTDAKGHIQRMAYNRAGQLIGSWLTVKNGVEQPIVYSLTYSAAGQKLREESGNGVITEYRYEPQTQRLIGIKTTRPAKKDRPTRLQDLRYDYDPVGNILAIHNDAEATRFYRNQKIVPETTYRYDALYQLIEATGREADTNGIQNSQLPALALLNDSNQLVNYTRHYHYDRAGNLLKIQHTGASQYSTYITVSDSSNHGIQQQDGITAHDVRSQFDAAGNQRQLQPGQLLHWNSRNQLQQVEPVPRNDGISDSESYLYDGSGSRVVKISLHKTHNAIQTRSVIYLAGLELRSQYNGNNLTEDFQVMTVGAAGRAQVRVLHWERGQPVDIVNDQLRYSFDNHIGSALIELDSDGDIISQEEYYPFGGTAVLASRNTVEAKYKTVRYSGKERDTTGLYYYGYRYYQPWLGRWLSADPAGTIDGLNLYRMVRNNPVGLNDSNGLTGINLQDEFNKLSVNGVIAPMTGGAIFNDSWTNLEYEVAVSSFNLYLEARETGAARDWLRNMPKELKLSKQAKHNWKHAKKGSAFSGMIDARNKEIYLIPATSRNASKGGAGQIPWEYNELKKQWFYRDKHLAKNNEKPYSNKKLRNLDHGRAAFYLEGEGKPASYKKSAFENWMETQTVSSNWLGFFVHSDSDGKIKLNFKSAQLNSPNIILPKYKAEEIFSDKEDMSGLNVSINDNSSNLNEQKEYISQLPNNIKEMVKTAMHELSFSKKTNTSKFYM
ncbi:RHS repeat-associated core domain-containing protein [Yersinia pseudotuberculosis]|uniref:RHS repeat-associated core domain-containing protein n=1 Tax=Yersinia pseudotuberculosis TaxID=633 RepID=UPI0038B48C8A